MLWMDKIEVRTDMALALAKLSGMGWDITIGPSGFCNQFLGVTCVRYLVKLDERLG